MKKIVLMFIVLVLLLGGCSNDTKDEVAEDEVIIKFVFDTDVVIYGIHIEYYLEENPMGGKYYNPADGSPFEKGEDIWVRFYQSTDFPEDADLSLFNFELYTFPEEAQIIAGETGEDEVLIKALSLVVEYGKAYTFSIIDNDGVLELKRIDT